MEIRRTKILGFTLLLGGFALCGTGLWMLLSPAQYQATAIIKLESAASDITGISGPPRDPSVYGPFYIQTEFEIIQSQVVLGKVVESLNLNVELEGKYGDGNPLEMAKSIKWLQRRMNLVLVRNTRLIAISFSSDDPNEAAGIANAIAKAYRDYRLEIVRQRSQKGLKVLEDVFQKEQSEIEAKQKNLEQLKKQLNLPNPEPSDDILKTNYSAYFQAKQELQKKIDFLKLLKAKIASDVLDSTLPRSSMVELIDTAQPPHSSTSPNRWLGTALLVIGLFPTLGALLLLKSSRRSVSL